jgi:hypothetical protein
LNWKINIRKQKKIQDVRLSARHVVSFFESMACKKVGGPLYIRDIELNSKYESYLVLLQENQCKNTFFPHCIMF